MISDRIMDRFLGISSPSAAEDGDEFSEDEILWSTEKDDQPNSKTVSHANLGRNSGILSTLPESYPYRKPILPAINPRLGTSIPRPHLPDRESFSGSKKLPLQHQSAPVKVPLLSMAIARERNKKFLEFQGYDEEREEEEILPPHEIVVRGSGGGSPKTTFSVLEGKGRTLKGSDLRQLRNAVWRRTGFLD